MTVPIRTEVAHTAPSSTRIRRRRLMIVAITVVVLVIGAATAGLVLRHLDHQYGPLEAGPGGGIDPSASLIGDTETRSAYLNGAGTGRVFATIGNSGSHSVKITSIDPTDVAVSYRWASFPDDDSVVIFGDATPWRDFPATIPADRYLQIEISIHRPRRCLGRPLQPNGGELYSPRLTVHWESLLGSEATTVDVWISREVQVC